MNKQAIIESLVIGRPLDNSSFSDKIHEGEMPRVKPNGNGSIDEVIKHLKNDLEEKAKGKVGLLLSGGKDSRMLAVVLKEIGVDTTCYTCHVYPESAEVKVAQKVAKSLGFEHKFIQLTVGKIYNEKYIKEIMKVTDGSPRFQSLLVNMNMRPEFNSDIIFTGDLVTEFLDSGEYRSWKEGQDINKALYEKENLRRVVNEKDYDKALTILKIIYKLNYNQLLIERKRDRIIRNNQYKKLGINTYQPATNVDVLNAAFSLPLRQRQDGRLIRSIVKKLNKDLYKMPTARSPFSLRWPLWFHIGWSKITHRQKYGNNGVRGRYGLIDKEILMDLDYEFLDKERIERKLNMNDRETIFRLDNLRQWQKLRK